MFRILSRQNVEQALAARILRGNCVTEVLAGVPPIHLQCDTLKTRTLKKRCKETTAGKLCSGVSRQEWDTGCRGFSSFGKIANCGRRNNNQANVISFVEMKWTRRLYILLVYILYIPEDILLKYSFYFNFAIELKLCVFIQRCSSPVKKKITFKETVFHYVYFGQTKHMKPKCVGKKGHSWLSRSQPEHSFGLQFLC